MNKKIGMLCVSLLFASIVLVSSNTSFADNRECKDLTVSIKYDSEGHKDNPESKTGFWKSLKNDSLCQFTEKHDKEQISGEVTSWKKIESGNVWKSSTEEQKECIREAFNSPDNGEKAAQGYEFEYCGWDED